MLGFDYLVIATGYRNDFNVVPGLGPGGNAYSITSLEGAVDAAEGWARLVNDPGPVVVAATQGRPVLAPPTSSCSTSPTSCAGRS